MTFLPRTHRPSARDLRLALSKARVRGDQRAARKVKTAMSLRGYQR